MTTSDALAAHVGEWLREQCDEHALRRRHDLAASPARRGELVGFPAAPAGPTSAVARKPLASRLVDDLHGQYHELSDGVSPFVTEPSPSASSTSACLPPSSCSPSGARNSNKIASSRRIEALSAVRVEIGCGR